MSLSKPSSQPWAAGSCLKWSTRQQPHSRFPALSSEQGDLLLPPAVPCQQGRLCSALSASTALRTGPAPGRANSRTHCPARPLPSTRGTQRLVCPPRDTNGERKAVASVSWFSKNTLDKVAPGFLFSLLQARAISYWECSDWFLHLLSAAQDRLGHKARDIPGENPGCTWYS